MTIHRRDDGRDGVTVRYFAVGSTGIYIGTLNELRAFIRMLRRVERGESKAAGAPAKGTP